MRVSVRAFGVPDSRDYVRLPRGRRSVSARKRVLLISAPSLKVLPPRKNGSQKREMRAYVRLPARTSRT